ncbi:hypothetical protein SNEBB_002550 [Seison nebaliae]|nr:hypothetical protein SNEBB_002550 [Seison nebaliae]
MPTTTIKHERFRCEPMSDKGIEEIAGIGDVTAGQLRLRGYEKASQLLGRLLLFDRNEEDFIAWMKMNTKANEGMARRAFLCLQAWCDTYL